MSTWLHLIRKRVCFASSCLVATAAFAQTPLTVASKAPESALPKPADYSAEPYVVENTATAVAVQSDGTYTSLITVRVRVQSQAGVEEFGIVSAPYPSANSTMQMVYVRVIKPDGQITQTPPENVLDMPAQITQQAPFYSDIKVQQVAVKGLAIGDVLEYQFREMNTKPIDPGEFWYTFNFVKDAVALDEEVEVSAPQSLHLKLQSPDVKPSTQQKDARTIYTWKTSNLKGVSTAKNLTPLALQHPSVEITTFRDWTEVGAWFNSLAAPQAAPGADIRAKALELTHNAKTDQEKIQALYDFVSTKYRYIGIDFGIGRYQPHSASDVMSNDYGDCKDKHTLFAALLAAVGIKAYPALISTEMDVDPDVPSPGQFDHVITAIPQEQGYLFLDTTPEVAPLGYLVAAIRDKKALVIPDKGNAILVQTPADPPFNSYLNFQADGNLDDAGTLVSKMQMSVRGDAEVVFRVALRQVSESQWNEAVQSISSNLGFGGTVSDASMSKVDATENPFAVTYTYTRKNYGDWDNKQIVAPLPMVILPAAPDESDKNPQPIEMGSPMELNYQGSMKLPAGSNPRLPEQLSLHETFADYQSKYSVSDGTLHVQRILDTKARRIPVDQIDSYREFLKAIGTDQTTFMPLFPTNLAGMSSSNSEAQALFDKGQTARQQNDMLGALDDYQAAANRDPGFLEAWLMLGYMHMYTGDRTQGVIEMKKAIELAPFKPTTEKYVANTFQSMRMTDDALELWKTIEKQNPEDPDAPLKIGGILMGKEQYADALPELQHAARLNPANAGVLIGLGESYAKTGDKEHAIASFQKAVMLDHSPGTLNDAGYQLADNNVDLDEALHFAQDAVKSAEAQTSAISLDQVNDLDYRHAWMLSAYWDTIAWVDFRLGRLHLAEDYAKAAWSLALDSTTALHLGEIYEGEGKTHEAVIAYADALAADRENKEAQARLDVLRPDHHYQAGETVDFQTLQSLRTFTLPQIDSSATAEFDILFASDGKVAGVKFIHGSEALHGKGEQALKQTKFNVVFPEGSSAQILRPGLLNCETVAAKCTFVLLPITGR